MVGTIILILSIITAVLLMLVVLIQNPKGGGLDSNFGAANQLGSVQKTNDVVEKATWVLASAIVVLALASSFFLNNKIDNGTSPQETQQLDVNYRNGLAE